MKHYIFFLNRTKITTPTPPPPKPERNCKIHEKDEMYDTLVNTFKWLYILVLTYLPLGKCNTVRFLISRVLTNMK